MAKQKFHKGDRVNIIDKHLQYGATPVEYEPYGKTSGTIGTIQSIIGNIYYVKIDGQSFSRPFPKAALEHYNEDKIVRETPKYHIGQHVLLSDKTLDDQYVRNTLAKIIDSRFKGTPTYPDKEHLKKIIQACPIEIVNYAYDKERVVYGLKGFGTLYFYEDEIEQTKQDKLKTYLGALENMFNTAQKITK